MHYVSVSYIFNSSTAMGNKLKITECILFYLEYCLPQEHFFKILDRISIILVLPCLACFKVVLCRAIDLLFVSMYENSYSNLYIFRTKNILELERSLCVTQSPVGS